MLHRGVRGLPERCVRVALGMRGLVTSFPRHRLMPMPRLSPTMQTGEIVRWCLREGDELDEMNVALEVRTAELTDDPEDGETILQVEAHESGYLAAILVPEGGCAAPDVAIAVVCQDLADVDAFQHYPRSPPAQVEPATFAWQAYLAPGQMARARSST